LAQRGSQYWIQRFVNEKPIALAERIVCQSASLASFASGPIEWKSPLATNGYYEYRDDFLEPLGLNDQAQKLQEHWPRRGPKWDALALVPTSEGKKGVLLVEAKAYPGESLGPGTRAEGDAYEQISRSLVTTKLFVGVSPETDWLGATYQLANRIAFLHFLLVTCNVPTWLVLINFVNDRTHRPTSMVNWGNHCRSLWKQMGVAPQCRLLDRIVSVFPDVSHWPSL
jgi:hypothetical protein